MTHLAGARTALFVPGDRPDRFAKASATGALVVLDLEDAVAPAARPTARENVRQWLENGGSGVVRVQASTAPGHADDVAAARGAPGLLGIMLARAERSQDVRTVRELAAVPVIALIETALGISRAQDLAGCADRLALGDQDLALDFGVAPRSALVRVLATELVLASRLAGLPPPLDGVTPEIDDDDCLLSDATASRHGGFGGKLCIHPRQVPLVERAFLPSEREIAWARSVLAAGLDEGGVSTADGAMVDRPLLERARLVLRDL